MKRLSLVAVVAFTLLFPLPQVCPPALAELTLNGDLEIDTSYLSTDDDDTDRGDTTSNADQQTTTYDLAGRIKVVPGVRKEAGRLYMEAKAEILAQLDGDVTVDDAWGKIGTSLVDFQIGRFEAWDLFYKSNDMLIVDAPNGPTRYETNFARGRFGAPGQAAIHVFPIEALGFEVGAVYGNELDDDDDDDDDANNKIGVRPVIDIKLGNFNLFGGVEYVQTTSTIDDDSIGSLKEATQFGYGGRLQGIFGILTLNLQYAHGIEGGKDDLGVELADETTDSYGALLDLGVGSSVLTLGSFFTTWEQDNNDYEKDHCQYYAAYAHPLPIDGATIKFAASYAISTEETATDDIDSNTLGFMMRLNYDF